MKNRLIGRLTTVVAAVALGVAGLIAVPTAAFAAGTTYYVDAASGSDANAGTSPGAAWQSLAKVNATTFAAGDQILFHTDQTWVGQLLPKGSGAAGSPIVLSDYGTGALPKFDGTPIARGGTVQLNNRSYWTIQNLDVSSPSTTAFPTGRERMGIFVNNDKGGTLKGITIQNNYVHDVNGCWDCSGPLDGHDNGGIVVGADVYTALSLNTNSYDGVQILNNTIDHVGRTGITFEDISSGIYYGLDGSRISHNVTVSGNHISNGDGDGITVRGAENVMIDHNVVANAGQKSHGVLEATVAGLWVAKTVNTTIQYNEVYGTRVQTGDGQGYDVDISSINTTVQYNYSHDNEGGFILLMWATGDVGHDVTVRDNLSVNDGVLQSDGSSVTGLFSFSYGVKPNTNIYNNTLYVAPGLASKIFSCIQCQVSYAWSFRNNIVANYGTGDYAYPTAGATIDSNTFAGNHPANEPADAHKLTTDPQFVAPTPTAPYNVAGFKVAATSPAVGSGVLIPANGGLDYFGNALSATLPPTRGFYEAQSF